MASGSAPSTPHLDITPAVPAKHLDLDEAEEIQLDHGDTEDTCVDDDGTDSEADDRQHSPLVMHNDNPWRRRWNGILCVLLVYVATIFPFRYAFLECHVPDGIEASVSWDIIEYIIDGLFWLDLVANFFFTYSKNGEEIDDLGLIAKNYLTGFFAINLFACLPPQAFAPIANLLADQGRGEHSGHKLARMSRLQRVTRLARLLRIGRVAVLVRMQKSGFFEYLRGSRGMRIINFVGFLLWVVHLLACGWYLCAGWHDDPQITWLYRREVDHTGKTLLEESATVQWVHSMYFVLTVFTTVGFGDMSAATVGEIFYVSFTMIVGVIVNSVIVGEVINIVGAVDGRQKQLAKTQAVIDGFCAHCGLQKKMRGALSEWVQNLSYRQDFDKGYDRDAMRNLLTNGSMPHKLLKLLPMHVYGGRLQNHKFITNILTHSHDVPPRLTLLLALSLSVRLFRSLEVVYQMHDNPFNVFLVDAGVFAYVGRAHRTGGQDEPASFVGKKAKTMRNKRPDILRGVKEAMGDAVGAPAYLAKSTSSVKPTHTWVVRKSSVVLYPYQLFCTGSYFGECELLEASARHCTARCEGQIGRRDPTLLVLHKADYTRLIDEFPHVANAWLTKSLGREQRRLERKARMTEARSYKQLAAVIIQRFVRRRQELQAAVQRPELQALRTSEIISENSAQFETGGYDGAQDSSTIAFESDDKTRTFAETARAASLRSMDSKAFRPFQIGKRRRLGGATKQMEEGTTAMENDSYNARGMMDELRQDMKALSKQLAEVRMEVSSMRYGTMQSAICEKRAPFEEFADENFHVRKIDCVSI